MSGNAAPDPLALLPAGYSVQQPAAPAGPNPMALLPAGYTVQQPSAPQQYPQVAPHATPAATPGNLDTTNLSPQDYAAFTSGMRAPGAPQAPPQVAQQQQQAPTVPGAGSAPSAAPQSLPPGPTFQGLAPSVPTPGGLPPDPAWQQLGIPPVNTTAPPPAAPPQADPGPEASQFAANSPQRGAEDVLYSALSGVPGVPQAGAAMDAVLGHLLGFGSQADSFGQRYQENMANEQARLQQVAPALRIPAEIGGNVLAAVGTGGLASLAGHGLAAAVPAAAPAINALSTASPLLRYTGAGAIQGGAQGASDAPTNADILPDALQGAGVGAALGAAVPIAGKVFGATRQAFSPEAGSTAAARKGIAKAIGRDSETPADVEARAATLAAARPGSAIWADALGENGQGTVERIATRPGAGMSQVIPTLKARQVGQLDRVSGDLASLTGGTKTDAFSSIQQQMQSRAAAARPLYAKAMTFDPTTNGNLMDAWSDATKPTTYGGNVLNSPDLKRMLSTVHGIDTPSNPQGLSMPVIDTWKKAMDDQQSAALRSGENAKARAIGNQKNQVVEAVDAANPAYAQARQAWAGPSAYADAIELGRSLITKGSVSPAEFTTTYNGLSDSEKEGFRIGASSNLHGLMRSNSAVTPDLTKAVRSPAMREKISAMMTPEAAADFNRKLDFEIQAAQLHAKAISGSPTARRLAAAEDHDQSQGINLPGAISVAANTAKSPIASGIGIATQAGKKVLGKIVDSKRAATDAKQAAFLMSPIDPARTNALSQFLAKPTAPVGSNALSFSKLGAITAGNTVANQRR